MSGLQEVRIRNQYYLRWLTHGKLVSEMFKAQNLKIFCYFSPLADPGGHCQCMPPPPNRIQFFHFHICFCQKAPTLEVSIPPNGSAPPPNGKSWICHCSLTSMGHEWVMFSAVILMFLVMICDLMVLLACIIIQTDKNLKHQ